MSGEIGIIGTLMGLGYWEVPRFCNSSWLCGKDGVLGMKGRDRTEWAGQGMYFDISF